VFERVEQAVGIRDEIGIALRTEHLVVGKLCGTPAFAANDGAERSMGDVSENVFVSARRLTLNKAATGASAVPCARAPVSLNSSWEPHSARLWA